MFENCTTDISQNTDSGAANATVTWTAPVGSDANGAVTTSSNYYPGDIFPMSPTVVIYEVIDGTNNTVNCTFTVTISGIKHCDTRFKRKKYNVPMSNLLHR